MLLNALFTSLLLAPAVLAVPSGLGTPIARRRGSFYTDSRVNNLERAADADSTGNPEYYSYDWAGAVLTESNGTFTDIIGTFTVPTLLGPNGAGVGAWIGIDGGDCPNLFLVGIRMTVGSEGPTYSAVYQWYPPGLVAFPGISSISAGDVLRLTITTTSPTSGTVAIRNMNNGQQASQLLSSLVPLCGQAAQWIVEDYTVNGIGYAPLADFGSITFTDAMAFGSGWVIHTLDGAAIVGIQQNNVDLTSVSTSTDTVTVGYIPPSN